MSSSGQRPCKSQSVVTIDSIGAELGIFAGTFVVCFVSGLVPVVNAS